MGSHQQALEMIAAAGGGATDPSFASVNCLLHFDGTNGSTTYTNSCPRGNTPTNNVGSPSLTTSNPLFGTASLDIANQNISGANSSDYGFGTGDFTVEFSFRTGTPAQTGKDLCNIINFPGSGGDWDVYITGSQFKFYNGVDRITGGTVATNTWQRIAVCRVSGTTRMFVDGVQVGSNYTDSTDYGNGGVAGILIGGYHTGSTNCTGQFDEFRLTKGVGRYAANYTPAVAAFPDS